MAVFLDDGSPVSDTRKEVNFKWEAEFAVFVLLSIFVQESTLRVRALEDVWKRALVTDDQDV